MVARIDWSESSLRLAVQDSFTFSDILRKLGAGVIGRNTDTLRKYLTKYGIEFRSTPHLRKRSGWKSNDEVFQLNSGVDPGIIKKKILQQNLIPYRCHVCNNDGNWNKSPLTLQLEHKNGNNKDHRLENLEFLCPNCHSQTSTWGGRNHKRIPDMVRKIKQPNVVEKQDPALAHLSVDELIALKQTNSFRAIGNMFGISDNAVRRWFKKLNLYDRLSS